MPVASAMRSTFESNASCTRVLMPEAFTAVLATEFFASSAALESDESGED